MRFWSPFWAPVDFEGVPKIAFLSIMLEKNEKKEVQERLQKKHEFSRNIENARSWRCKNIEKSVFFIGFS